MASKEEKLCRGGSSKKQKNEIRALKMDRDGIRAAELTSSSVNWNSVKVFIASSSSWMLSTPTTTVETKSFCKTHLKAIWDIGTSLERDKANINTQNKMVQDEVRQLTSAVGNVLNGAEDRLEAWISSHNLEWLLHLSAESRLAC